MKKDLKKRITAGTLAFSLLLAACAPLLSDISKLAKGEQIEYTPIQHATYAAETNNISVDDADDGYNSDYATVDDLLNPTISQDINDFPNPYGETDKNPSVVLDPLNELIRFGGYDYPCYDFDMKRDAYRYMYMDTMQHLNWDNASNPNTLEEFASSRETGKPDKYDNLWYYKTAKSVAYDGHGTGRKDCLAVVGAYSSDTIYTTTYDLKTKKSMQEISYGSYCLPDYKEIESPTFKDNFYDITVGDYDGDGVDSVLVFRSWSNPGRMDYGGVDMIIEYKVDTKTGKLNQVNSAGINKTGYRSKLLHELVRTTDFSQVSGYNTCDSQFFLRGRFTTADVNDDGIDDLIFASNVTYEGFSPKTVDPRCSATNITVSLGGKGKNILRDEDTMYSTMLYDETSNGVNICYNASVGVGDVDNSGVNSIIASGASINVRNDGTAYLNSYYPLYKMQLINGTLRIAVNNTLRNSDADRSAYKTNKGFLNRSFKFHQYPVAVFKYKGIGYEEAAYVNGYVVTLKGTSEPTHVSGLSAEAYISRSYVGIALSSEWTMSVDEVCVGNFSNRQGGFEQIITQYSFVDKDLISNPFGSFGCIGYDKNMKPDRLETLSPMYMAGNRNSICLAAADTDDDSAQIRLNTKFSMFEDVKPLAILQAAPYFGDLYDNDRYNLQGGGSTSLTISYRSGTAYGEKSSYSSELGSYETETAVVESVTSTSGGKDYFESSWTDSMSYEVKETFKSGTIDTIIVYQTPVFFYVYDVYDKAAKKWVEGNYVVYAEQKPVFSQMTIQEYNKYANRYMELAANIDPSKTSYNLHDETIKPIDISLLEGNEGNPSAYNFASLFTGIESFTLGYSGGSSTASFAVEKTSETYTENSSGSYFTLEAGVGLSYLGASAFIGVSYATESMSGATSSTVSSKSITYQGTVDDVRTTVFIDKGYEATLAEQYGFTWTLGYYDTNISVDSFAGTNKLRIYTYSVTDVREPVGSPTITKCNFVEGTEDLTVEIDWEVPNTRGSRTELAGYNLYSFKIVDGVYSQSQKVNNSLIDKNTTHYQANVDSKTVGFYLRAVGIDGVEGLKSNNAVAISATGVAIKKATHVDTTSIDGNKYYVYKISYNDGTSYDKVYFKASQDNNGVLKDTATYNFAVLNGFDKTYQVYLYTIDTLCSYANHIYSQDNNINISSCEGPTITSYVCSICGHAHTEYNEEGHGHSYKEVVVEPTCSEQGYTLHICSECGASYKDNYVECSEHNYATYTVLPTREQQGYTFHVCLDCGFSYKDNYVEKLSYNEFYSGHGAPEATLGLNGDSYLDIDSGNIYEKVDNEWSISSSAEGVVVVSVNLISSDELNDTYQITYSNGSTSTFTIAKEQNSDEIFVGENGNWFINKFDTGIKAQQTLVTVTNVIENNISDTEKEYKVYFSNGEVTTLILPKDETPIPPYVGGNGNWFVNNVDSGVASKVNEVVATNIAFTGVENNNFAFTITYSDGITINLTMNVNSDGQLVYKGNGAPNDIVGTDGQIYVDLTNWLAYQKVDGVWVKTMDLKEVLASSMYTHDGYWYIGSYNTNVPAAGNEGKTVATVSKTVNEDGRYNFHVTFTDSTTFDYLAPEGFEPVKLTTGTFDPVSSLGEDNDVYLNVKTMDAYRKDNGTWTYIGNLNDEICSIVDISQVTSTDNTKVYTISYSDDSTSNFVVRTDNDIIEPKITINEDGNWVINGFDTGVAALGDNGKNEGAVFAANNGKWAVNGVDTGVVVTKNIPAWAIATIVVGSIAVAGTIIAIVGVSKKKKHQ